MASQVLTDCKAYVASFDVSGDMNALALTYAAEMLDGSTFGSDTRVNTAGLKAITAQIEGLWDSDGVDEPDDIFFSRVGSGEIPVTICPQTGADGEVAFLFRATQADYTPGGAVGEMFAFTVSMEGGDGAPLVRGRILQPAGAETATGTGTGRELGAVSSTQTLYGSLHVIAASGTAPTLDVVVQSDTASNFPSPVTALTFTQKTAIGSDWQTRAGALTDTWYRVSFTIGGTSPSFSFVVAVGIK